MTQLSGQQPANAKRWWPHTIQLALLTLAVLAIFAFAVHAFVGDLDTLVFFGFPLGYYMAAQGSVIAFVVLAFWFVDRQERIDRNAGLAEPAPRDPEDSL
ncbi:DUF4212 domain-containing protein [Stappia sp.]|uniref:DUF4212 domain-containing protein n=1 Tax=Stappia sp. TaxID=1870903 RepID=UPI003A9A56BF